MIYRTLEELGNNILSLNDTVYFYINGKQLKYYVKPDHLANALKYNNEEIFSILDIKKEDFCKSYYGYNPYGGDWPTCRYDDFTALTRVVKALYLKIIDKKTKGTSIFYLESKNLIQGLKNNLSNRLSNPSSTASLVLEKKEETSSNILVKRKLKVKRIIGEEPIKLNNY